MTHHVFPKIIVCGAKRGYAGVCLHRFGQAANDKTHLWNNGKPSLMLCNLFFFFWFQVQNLNNIMAFPLENVLKSELRDSRLVSPHFSYQTQMYLVVCNNVSKYCNLLGFFLLVYDAFLIVSLAGHCQT